MHVMLPASRESDRFYVLPFRILTIWLLFWMLIAVTFCLMPGKVHAAQRSSRAWQKIGTRCYNGLGNLIPGAITRGLDLSEYDGRIDWPKLAGSNVDFVFLRAFHGSHIDTRFYYNIAGAVDAGIPVGVYVYSCAATYTDALEEAQNVIRMVDGYRISYPIVFDLEDDLHQEMPAEKLSKLFLTFAHEIERAGYTPMLYCNRYFYGYLLDTSLLEPYDLWLAAFLDDSAGPDRSLYPYTIWQATSGTNVEGHVSTADLIKGLEPGSETDIDFGYVDYRKRITPRSHAREDYSRASAPEFVEEGWIRTAEGRSYYRDGKKLTGWKKIDGIFYNFSPDGILRTNRLIRNASGAYRYADENGAMAKNRFVTVNEHTYYVGKNGLTVKGLVTLEGSRYFFSEKTFRMLRKKRFIYNGKIYYATSTGVLMTSRFKWFLRDGRRIYYYFSDNGSALTGLKTINGKTYFFYRTGEDKGIRAQDTTIVSSRGTCYEFGSNGVLVRKYRLTA